MYLELENQNTDHDFDIGHHHRIHRCYCTHSTKPKSDTLGCSCLLDIQPHFQSTGRLLWQQPSLDSRISVVGEQGEGMDKRRQ